MSTKQKTKLPSTAVGRRRLLKLAGLLEADAKNKKGIKFDLNVWAKPANAEYYEFFNTRITALQPPQDCGTAACAIGLACISGAFKRQGLTMAYRRSSVFGGRVDYMPIPAIGRRRNFEAVDKFFLLDREQSEWLFLPEEYPVSIGAKGERAVARRIRQFVAGKASP